jgi:hypothetical protein
VHLAQSSVFLFGVLVIKEHPQENQFPLLHTLNFLCGHAIAEALGDLQECDEFKTRMAVAHDKS